jgi:hypothetical protein
VPAAVVEATAMVMVEVPAPVMLVGLKDTVTPVGAPDEVSAIAELKPPVTVEVMVLVPLLPAATVTLLGEADKLKPGCEAAFTVRLMVVVSVVEPLVPVTVTVEVPVVAVALAVKVSVELPAPVTEVGLNAAVTPEGRPEAENVTAESNPPETATVMVEVAVEPWVTETLLGEADSE